ncbi:DUF6951 family protein [Clostridium grantii]|uniref:Uncharacterized protein n=1 Tax=Clostridium grantii DSM 8605 TaxID=1121316 RepID=A0A1M5QMG2_9CLOT|nr:hypothetical protein [Clostridium grantii]SHH15021.1 hypothetical protein SAMN02745207_00176 [Clostridium grantii DSM 8605]
MNVTINPGICGFITNVYTSSDDMQNVTLKIETECPSLKPIESELKIIDGFSECFGTLGDTDVYKICRNHCHHAACPIPAGIIKSIEVACGLALPSDCSIKFVSNE